MHTVIQDVRYALRQLRKSPGFTITAVLTLALGIGATTAMYSIVRDVLLAPLPYPQQQELVGIGFTFPQEKPNAEQAGTSADFLAQHSRSFAAIGISDDGTYTANLSLPGTVDAGHAVRIASLRVSRGYLGTLGIAPAFGRTFSAEEDLPGGPKVVVLSYALWQRSFNGDRGIVGRVIHLNQEAFTVIGVMPRTFSVASESSPESSSSVDAWQPLQLTPKDAGYEGDNYQMVARLRPGVNLVQAQQELNALKQPFYQQFPNYLSWTSQGKVVHEFRAWPLQDVLVSQVKTSLLTMMAAVAAVMMVACLNLAGLMTARTSRRMSEIALRTALGASPGRLLRLLLCESLMLALTGGVLGLAIARAGTGMLLTASRIPIPQWNAGASGWVLAGIAALLACATTIVFGLPPALLVFRQNALKAFDGSRTASTLRSQARLGNVMIVGQIALSMVLLSAASMLLGSFLKLRSMPLGVVAKRLVVAQVALKGDAYANTMHTRQFIEKVLAGLGHYPGVERVAAINGLPLDRGLNTEARPVDRPERKQNVEFRAITPGYFRTMGITLISGRDLTDADGAQALPVALISETTARRWWPSRSALGERITAGGEATRTVVGVVADTRGQSLAEAPRIMIYAPFSQLSDGMTKMLNGWFPTTFAVRVSGEIAMGSTLERAVRDADAEIPVARVEGMQAVIDDNIAAPHFLSWLAASFAGFAVLLTVIGLFGLLSYQVTQRTREIGVRLAVGATRRQILLFILQRGLVLTLAGIALGGLASRMVPRMISSVLADTVYTGGAEISTVMSSGIVALLIAALGMLAAALLGSFLPARRAASIEPMEALRAE